MQSLLSKLIHSKPSIDTGLSNESFLVRDSFSLLFRAESRQAKKSKLKINFTLTLKSGNKT